MNIYGYPMPLTVHIQKNNLTRALDVCKQNMYSPGMMGRVNSKVPKYKTLYVKGKKVFTTNLLFQTTEVQRSRIKKAYEENPNNECFKFFYEQIAGRGFKINDDESYSFNELM